MDKETKSITREGKLLRELTKHEGYGIAKGKMLSKVSNLIDISTLDLNQSPEKLSIEVQARKVAAELILAFFKDDIEATADQSEANNPLTLNDKSYIIRKADEPSQTSSEDSTSSN